MSNKDKFMNFLPQKTSIIVLTVVMFLSGCSGGTRTPVDNNTVGKSGASNSGAYAPIVFTAPSEAGRDFSNNIYIVEASGKGLRQLTNSGKIGTVKYSPETGEILYSVHYDAATFHWHIMDVTGQNHRQLTIEPTISNYRWLPGEGLVYEEIVSGSEPESRLTIKNIKTGSEKKVPAAPLPCSMYSVTPDGNEIWCLGGKPGNNTNMLLCKQLDGEDWNTAVKEVPLPDNSGRMEKWSPDGNYLVFSYYEADQTFLKLAERSSEDVNLEFMDRFYQGNSPLWDQEGIRLAFYNREGIWITKPGKDPQLYLPCEGVTELLQWQEKEIVFTLRDGDTFAVIRTDGGNKNILAQLTITL